MNEEELFALVGRLYVGILNREKQIKNLQDALQSNPIPAFAAPAEVEPDIMDTADAFTD